MERKVIQIAVEGISEGSWATLFALCDDGSLWMYEFAGKAKENWEWVRIEGVPASGS
jgi:hypothetical protein